MQMTKKTVLNKRNKKGVLGRILYYAFGILLTAFFLFPFFALISRSFMTVQEVADIPKPLLPKAINFENYIAPFKDIDSEINILRSTWNSLYIMVLKVIGVTLTSFLCAFSLSRIRFRGRKLLFTIGMMTIMIPSIVTLLPLLVVYRGLGWISTTYPLWVPAFFGGGMMTIFLQMQFIRSVPRTMDEAAIIDGANYWQLAWKVVFPLVKPVLIYVAVTTAIGSWNDFLAPMTYVSSDAYEQFTLPLAFYYKFQSGGLDPTITRPHEQAALAVIMLLPVFIIFAFNKDKMIDGVALSAGIKG
jgi:multiple sugar transport system permease protein